MSELSPPEELSEELRNGVAAAPLLTAEPVVRENYPVATVVRTEDYESPHKAPLRRRITHIWKSFRRSLSRGTSTNTALTASTTLSSQGIANHQTRSERPDPPEASDSLQDSRESRHVSTSRSSSIPRNSENASGTIERESQLVSSLPQEDATTISRHLNRPAGASLDGSLCTSPGHEIEAGDDAQVGDSNVETFESVPAERRCCTTEHKGRTTSILQLTASSNQEHLGPGAFAIPGIDAETCEASNGIVQETTPTNNDNKLRWDFHCRPRQAPDLLQSFVDPESAEHMNLTCSKPGIDTQIPESYSAPKPAKSAETPDPLAKTVDPEVAKLTFLPDPVAERGKSSLLFQAQRASEDTVVMMSRGPSMDALADINRSHERSTEQPAPTERRQDPPGMHAAYPMIFENQSSVPQQRILAAAVSDAVAAAAEAAAAASKAADAAMSISRILIDSAGSDTGHSILSTGVPNNFPPATLALNEDNRPISEVTLLAGSTFHDSCAATKVQALVRGALCRHKIATFGRRETAAALIRSEWRGDNGRASFRRRTDISAILIQCAWRTHSASALLMEARAAVVTIQSKLRCWSSMQKYRTLLMEAHAAVVTIQAALRRWSCGRKFQSMQRTYLSTIMAIRRFKQEGFKIILLDHLAYELNVGDSGTLKEVLRSLKMIVYHDDVDEYIILCAEFCDSVVSEFKEIRARFVQRKIEKDEDSPENDLMRMFTGEPSYCPLLSNSSLLSMYTSMESLRPVEDSLSYLPMKATAPPQTVFGFFKRLLIRSKLLMPLSRLPTDLSRQSDGYFVSGMLPALETDTVWTYKSSKSWKTTLCHKWTLPPSAPPNLLEEMMVRLIQDLYHFSKSPQDPLCPNLPRRAQSCPSARSLHGAREPVTLVSKGIRIHQIVCWSSAVRIEIATVDNNLVEIFIALVDESSPHFVGMDGTNTQVTKTLVVSGKGLAGQHGKKLWEGGYKVVVESVQALLSSHVDVDTRVACPKCLAHRDPSRAGTWSRNGILGFIRSGLFDLCCTNGHPVDLREICGMVDLPDPFPEEDELIPFRKKHVELVQKTLPRVVLVCLQDRIGGQVIRAGSGFLVDGQRGLIVTAAHVLFSLNEGSSFGSLLYKDARVVIGITKHDTRTAEFRYIADIVAKDVRNVDACVLRIKNLDEHREQLPSLETTTHFEMEEKVRLFGYNQGGEGLHEPGTQLNQSCDFAKGYVCREFAYDHTASTNEGFMPRKEIVLICPNIAGHSGGPVVNQEGKVIGILSRGIDPANQQRCYLAPSSEIDVLVRKAQQQHESATLPSSHA